MGKMQDVWPLFPISVRDMMNLDDFFAALEHNDRIRQFKLHLNIPHPRGSGIQL